MITLELEKLLSLPMTMFIVPSPDAKKIVFLSNKTKNFEFYIYNLSDKSIVQITENEFPIAPLYAPIWTGDSNKLLFCKDAIGKEKFGIYELDIKTNEIRPLTDEPKSQNLLGQINHKNNQIAFFSDRTGETQIYTMDVNGKNVKQHTNFKGFMFGRRITFPWVNLKYSGDDSKIFFTGNVTNNRKNFSIFEVDLTTNVVSDVLSLSEDSKELLIDLSSDGSQLLFYSDISGVEQMGILNLIAKEIQWFGDKKYDEIPRYFSSNSSFIVGNRNQDAELKLIAYRTDTGKQIEFPLVGFNNSSSALNDQKIVVYHEDSTHNGEIYLFHLQTGEKELLIPADHKDYSPEIDFHPDEYVSYPSTDNVTIHAILIKPRQLEKGKKYPAIMSIHGGPTTQEFRKFSGIVQFAVAKGFILLVPNNRGSTGYGSKFRDSCLNDWGGKDLEDVEAGVNYLKTLDFIDKDKIGVAGGSYGGFMTYRSITKKPQLFKVACAINGITDLVLNHHTAQQVFPWMALWFESQMGNPTNLETLEIWNDRSPITRACQLEAKLLIIHAENDPRCAFNQAETFMNKLKECQKENLVELVILKGRGHSLGSTENIITVYGSAFDFFIKYLK